MAEYTVGLNERTNLESLRQGDIVRFDGLEPYKIIRLLDGAAYGVVYLAESLGEESRQVALKIAKAKPLEDYEGKPFAMEIRALRSLNNAEQNLNDGRRVTPVLYEATSGGAETQAIAMEYIRAPVVYEVLEDIRPIDVRHNLDRATTALEEAKQSLIHLLGAYSDGGADPEGMRELLSRVNSLSNQLSDPEQVREVLDRADGNRVKITRITVRAMLDVCRVFELLHQQGTWYKDWQGKNIRYDPATDSTKVLDFNVLGPWGSIDLSNGKGEQHIQFDRL